MTRGRKLSEVPAKVTAIFTLAVLAQLVCGATRPAPVARASELDSPPGLGVLRVASLGEPIAAAQWLTLSLQAYDNQPGISIPFLELDYGQVRAWLTRILELDPNTNYPLLMAAQLYGQVPDEAKQRLMLQWVHEQFMHDPNLRWRYLAHAAIMAKHRLHDMSLALAYARDIAARAIAPEVPAWARQMHIFLLEDMGEYEGAKILLGGLLAGGTVTDAHEIHFLMERLAALKAQTK